MGKLVGDGKQKIFFRIVSTGLLLGCAYLLVVPEGHGRLQSNDVATRQTISTKAPEENEGTQANQISPSSKGLEADNSEQLQETLSSNQQVEESDSLEAIGIPGDDAKVKGIYVTGPVAGSKEKMDKLVHLVDTTVLNSMVIDIKNDSGEITYNMDYRVASEIGATKNYVSDMQGLVKRLKERNIYLIARIVVFKDPILAEKMPQYSIHKRDGSLFRDRQGLAWVNPYDKEVWKYVRNVAARAADLGFDEIQFDYIRFPTEKGLKDADYGAASTLMNKQEVITQFTQCMSNFLRKKDVKVSADVFGGVISSQVDSELIGQDYVEMADCLDCISPMIYPSQFAKGCYGVENPDNSPYDIVYKSLLDSQEKLTGNQNVTVRPWLQDFTASWLSDHIAYNQEEIKAQIDAVYASGYDEWILWNAGNNYTVGGIH